MIKVIQYQKDDGSIPFETWLDTLDIAAEKRVSKALTKLQEGHTGSVKSLSNGLFESKVNFGPRCRIYFGQQGSQLIILIGGGSKKTQQRDIDHAKTLWTQIKKELN